MVVFVQQKFTGVAHSSKKPNNDDRLQCIQQGLGSYTEQQVMDRWCMVNKGGSAPHQLPRAPGCLPNSPSFQEDLGRDHNSVMYRQCHSSDIYKPEGRYNFQSVISVSSINMELVHSKEPPPGGRTSPRTSQYNGGPGIMVNQRLLRLDAKSWCISPDPDTDGPTGDRPICFMLDKTASLLL